MATIHDRCPTCGEAIAYRYCLDKFHSQPIPNPFLDSLLEVQERLKYPPIQ